MSVETSRRPYRLAIAIPASLTADIPHLREKTGRIGLIGRAAAIFRVNEILVYRDEPNQDQSSDCRLILEVLRYMETPPYLRKYQVKIRPELRYAGTLPPLLSAHHPKKRSLEDLKIGGIREGFVVSSSKTRSHVDIGVGRPIEVEPPLSVRSRVTIRIRSVGTRFVGEPIQRDRIQIYWGFSVSEAKLTLGRLTKSGDFDLKIATSRYGAAFPALAGEVRARLSRSRSVLLAFGSPRKGVREILQQEGLRIEAEFDYVLNTLPNQSVETVRTEEAVVASLAVINTLE